MRHVLLATALLTSACATAEEPAPAPDFTPLRGDALGEVAGLYSACIAAAEAAGDVVEAHPADTHLMLFRCQGAPAQALYARLGPWSEKIGATWRAQGRTWRSSTKVQRDLVGVDYCSARDDGAEAVCVITLNVGEVIARR